jgi:hypothetical protein
MSPHWLRHAHASHALDHGAPIHLVQATLGHSSLATTTAYLHARPGDSSARFLATETFLPKPGGSTLPLQSTRVMDVVNAVPTAPGDYSMTTMNEETKIQQFAATPAGPKQPKATKKATAAPQKPAVAPAKAKSGKKASAAKKAPKAAKGAKPAEVAGGTREGSKTAQALALLRRPNGATLAELMKTLSWQAHSVRGFISGTLGKKLDLPVMSAKREDGARVYSIAK